MSDDNEVQELRDFLRRNGFVPCDIPACNCGSWHGGHANQRLREISEALDTAGLRRNGEAILADVVKTTMDNERLRAAVTALAEIVQRDRVALYEAHHYPHSGEVDEEGREALAEYDAALRLADAALGVEGTERAA